MRKSDRERKWEEIDIRNFLQESANDQQIPQSLLPQHMEERLKQKNTGQEKDKDKLLITEKAEFRKRRKRNKYFGWWCGTFAAAACMALVLFAAGHNLNWKSGMEDGCIDMTQGEEEAADGMAASDTEKTTYKKLYENFDKIWSEQEKLDLGQKEYAKADGGTNGAETAGQAEEGAERADLAAEDSSAETETSAENSSEDYGKTNQQEQSVEEADIIKNDGRYLYQVIFQKSKESYTVRIADTKDGLTEITRIGDFAEIQDIYVSDDMLIVLEPGWAESSKELKREQTEYLYEDNKENGFIQIIENQIEKVFHTDSAVDLDMTDEISGYAFCRIRIYDIADRRNPQECHTFTVKGNYMDSRISDGYLYFFASCDASRPERPENFKTYVPVIDGGRGKNYASRRYQCSVLSCDGVCRFRASGFLCRYKSPGNFSG